MIIVEQAPTLVVVVALGMSRLLLQGRKSKNEEEDFAKMANLSGLIFRIAISWQYGQT